MKQKRNEVHRAKRETFLSIRIDFLKMLPTIDNSISFTVNVRALISPLQHLSYSPTHCFVQQLILAIAFLHFGQVRNIASAFRL